MNAATADVARNLFYVHRTKIFVDWGFPRFADFIKEDLNISYRKTMHLVELYNDGVMRLGYTNTQLAQILGTGGWGKCSTVLRGLETRMPIRQLLTLLKQTCVEIDAQQRDVRQFNVTLSGRYYRKLERVLKANGMDINDAGSRQNVGAAFETMLDSVVREMRLRQAA